MQLQDALDRFAQRAESLRREFIWENPTLRLLSAAYYDAEDLDPDPVAIREMQKMIRCGVSVFNEFRGLIQLGAAAKLSLMEEPELRLEEALACFSHLKEAGFRGSPYLVMAALEIVCEGQEGQDAASGMCEWFQAMRRVHPYLSAQDDYLYAALLSLKGINPHGAAEEYQEMERLLASESGSGNALQSLTHVLMLAREQDMQGLCLRTREIVSSCRAKQYGLRFTVAMPLAGILALLPGGPETLVDELLDGERYLKSKRGFSGFSLNRGLRLLFTLQEMILLRAGGFGQTPRIPYQTLLDAQLTALTAACVSVMISDSATAAT